MKVVLDEGVPRQMARALRELGLNVGQFDKAWRAKENGELIATLEAAGYDVLLTNDKNIAYQQTLKGRSFAVVALPMNRRAAIVGRAKDIADTLARARHGQHLIMRPDGTRSVRRHVEDAVVTDDLPEVAPF